jgi:hypothetical protein
MVTSISNSTSLRLKDLKIKAILTWSSSSINRCTASSKHQESGSHSFADYGFELLASDSSIYYSHEHQVFLAVYVEDIFIFGKNQQSCDEIFQYLSQQFKVDYPGPPKTLVGLNILRSGREISINQSGYINRMLSRFQMTNASDASTPLPPSLPPLNAQNGERMAD